jgi:alpha-methylacyl-CoA racemase
MVRPLEGIRILDLTRLLPGAYATLLLADLGAEVIKLEDPRGGDTMRHMPPLTNGTGVYFQLLNRNKRSVTLDLRAADAAAVLDALLASSDVVADSFRPRTAGRLGVDADRLRRRHPRLICASISGFGHSGPYVDRAAHDINYEGLVGLLTASTAPRAAPGVPRLLVADIGAAMHAAAGILAALFQRERTGAGAFVDVAIHDAALSWMLFHGARTLAHGPADDTREVPLNGEAACYNIYVTADDRYLALGALEPKFWAGFCDRIGRSDLIPLQAAQGAEQQRVLAEVRAIMRMRTRDEWLAFFAADDVCLTEIKSLAEALVDPHLAARGLFARRDNVTYIALPGVSVRPAPLLGADTDGVLEQAGIDQEERARLRACGVL